MARQLAASDADELKRLEDLSCAAISRIVSSGNQSFESFAAQFPSVVVKENPRWHVEAPGTSATRRAPAFLADDAERCAVWDDKAMLHAAVAEMKAAALEDAAEQRRLRAAALLRDDDVDFLLGGGDVCGGGLGVPGDARVHVDNFCVDDGGAPSDGSDEESFCMIPTDSSDEEDAPLRAALKALAPKPAALPTAKRRPPEAASRSQLRPPARPATQDDDGFVPPIPRGFLWEESQVEFTLEPVEAFLLDPDFDYDNVQCTPRLSPEAELEAWKATSPAQTRDGPGDGPDADDDGDVIVVEED